MDGFYFGRLRFSKNGRMKNTGLATVGIYIILHWQSINEWPYLPCFTYFTNNTRRKKRKFKVKT